MTTILPLEQKWRNIFLQGFSWFLIVESRRESRVERMREGSNWCRLLGEVRKNVSNYIDAAIGEGLDQYIGDS
jgi:hypothetical protein